MLDCVVERFLRNPEKVHCTGVVENTNALFELQQHRDITVRSNFTDQVFERTGKSLGIDIDRHQTTRQGAHLGNCLLQAPGELCR